MTDESSPPPAGGETLRISHFLARAGVASRRKSEDIVREGRVALNGTVVVELGSRVDPGRDTVTVDGKPVRLEGTTVVLAMNKPRGVVVTRQDEQGRRTVYDLIPSEFARHVPALAYAGRLDIATSGLLLLTTDGELVNRLTHPRHAVEKTYHCSVDAPLSEDDLKRLREGIDLGEFRAQPCEVRPASIGGAGFQYELVLREGKNREIRRMMEALGRRVARLRRVAVGKLDLRSLRLPEGGVRALSPSEIRKLTGGDGP